MKTDLIIDVQDLHKYFGSKHVVKGINLQVKRGEIFGFLGPNGSGKTTTIRMLCGLLTPDKGLGHCMGYDILTESMQIKLKVGYMTQKFSFYEDLTIAENLDFIARVYQIADRKRKVKECIERLGFSKRQQQLTGQLSGGWKQRVALAACLLHDPELLLLDEPTAGVDPKARREFWDHIHDLSRQGITTLVSTHYMDEAERCTQLAYIAYGDLLVHGTIEDILAKIKLYTWAIRGDNLVDLAAQLKQEGIEQVVIFGNTLHVSSKNEEILAKQLAFLQTSTAYQCQKENTRLEDVFIYLVNQTSDN